MSNTARVKVQTDNGYEEVEAEVLEVLSSAEARERQLTTSKQAGRYYVLLYNGRTFTVHQRKLIW